MSFITRCPSCSTSFKVVADQLRISQGWVRCGHCADIFDANQDLKPWVPTPPVLTTVVDEQQQPSQLAWARAARDHEEPLTKADSPLDGVLDGLAILGERDANRQDITSAASEEVFGRDDPNVEQRPEWADTQPREPVLDPWPSEPGLPIDVLRADGDEVHNAAPDPEPRFVQKAKRQAFWASAHVRAGLWLGVVVSVLGLGLQWAVHDRDRLAAWQPSLKPILMALCQPLGCEIGPVRQLQAVVIESSSLVRLLGQLHALDVVLKNSQAWPVALPSLEVSLTDAQEQVLVRRVLRADEWPDAPSVLAPGEAWPLKLRLSITLPSNQTMSGYRIALFYP
jgi:predicted Zn finger-like uncharacterized protein